MERLDRYKEMDIYEKGQLVIKGKETYIPAYLIKMYGSFDGVCDK